MFKNKILTSVKNQWKRKDLINSICWMLIGIQQESDSWCQFKDIWLNESNIYIQEKNSL